MNKPRHVDKKEDVRRIRGLKWAELRPESPWPYQRPRRSAVKRGRAYERKTGRVLRRMIKDGELSGVLHLGQWFLFSDQNGTGWAQADAYLVMKDKILLMECKLTQNDTAVAQMISLYLPILRYIYDLPVLCLQVCRNLHYVPSKFVESPQELIDNPGPGAYTWNLLG